MAQVQSGCSESAQRGAISLWLQRLSMTDGYLVKTMLVEGGWGEVLRGRILATCEVRIFFRFFSPIGS